MTFFNAIMYCIVAPVVFPIAILVKVTAWSLAVISDECAP
jgi:hypothetical protein